jgi:hypothetical protein
MAVVNAEIALGSGTSWNIQAPADMVIRCMVKVGGVSDLAVMPTFQAFISLAELL